LRILRRILIAIVVMLAVVFLGAYCIEVALSFSAAKKVSPVARIVPADLNDKSVSEAPGTKLSYFGYEFEVPWSDLDETQTKLYPKDKSEKCKVDLHFRSGLRLLVTAVPPREWAKTFVTEFKSPPQKVDAAITSDYSFVRSLYALTPDRVHHWALSPDVHTREEFWLAVKSVALSDPASASGIFKLQNQSYKGFQQGNPQVRPVGIIVNLYSDDGSVEMIFSQKGYIGYKNSAGVTQPEINRSVQSLRKAPQNESTTPGIAQK
jgi:hypothetical protein